MSLSSDDLALLVRAAAAAGLDAGRLRPANPWAFTSTAATALQAAVSELDPVAAERLQQEAGITLSLGATAALEGLSEWSDDLLAELARVRPDAHRRLQQEREEAFFTSSMGAFMERQKEASEVAAAFGYNVARLIAAGHNLAAQIASQHQQQQQREAEQKARDGARWLRS